VLADGPPAALQAEAVPLSREELRERWQEAHASYPLSRVSELRPPADPAAFASALVSAAGVAAAGAAAPIGAVGNGFREGAPTTAPSGAAGNGFRDFREGARLTGSAIYEATHGLTKPAAGWTHPPAGLGAGLSGQVLELRCPDCMLIAIDCR
jgi:hypothetical protein